MCAKSQSLPPRATPKASKASSASLEQSHRSEISINVLPHCGRGLMSQTVLLWLYTVVCRDIGPEGVLRELKVNTKRPAKMSHDGICLCLPWQNLKLRFETLRS